MEERSAPHLLDLASRPLTALPAMPRPALLAALILLAVATCQAATRPDIVQALLAAKEGA